MTAPDEPGVWVFDGAGGKFPAAVFSTVGKAEEWIGKHMLTGVLTWYPLDVGVYEWVIEKGYWEPKRDDQRTPEFIQRFSSAHTGHHHYENGRRD
jgi:hypothetical protein